MSGTLRLCIAITTCLLCAICVLPTLARQEPDDSTPVIDWQEGPTVGKLGNVAELAIPEGYLFAGSDGAQKVLELTENVPSGNELGVVIPIVENEQDMWFVIFEFNRVGNVPDDEKDKLDPDSLLGSVREATEEANKVRRQRGWNEVHVVGWERPPSYDIRTNNLTWAIRAASQDGESVNYSTRLLGQRGYMNVDLVLAPEQLSETLGAFEGLISEFSYVQGQTYAGFRKGDKLAAYGLGALVVGGRGLGVLLLLTLGSPTFGEAESDWREHCLEKLDLCLSLPTELQLRPDTTRARGKGVLFLEEWRTPGQEWFVAFYQYEIPAEWQVRPLRAWLEDWGGALEDTVLGEDLRAVSRIYLFEAVYEQSVFFRDGKSGKVVEIRLVVPNIEDWMGPMEKVGAQYRNEAELFDRIVDSVDFGGPSTRRVD